MDDNRKAMTLQSADNVIDRFIRDEFASSADFVAMRDEVAKARLFLLHPTGAERSPAWDIWPVADPSGPEVASELRFLEAADEADLLDDDPDAYFELQDRTPLRGPSAEGLKTLTGQVLYPSNLIAYDRDASAATRVVGRRLQGPLDFGVDLIEHSDPIMATRSYIGGLTMLAAEAERFEDTYGTEISVQALLEEFRGELDGAVVRQHDTPSSDRAEAMERAADQVAGEIASALEQGAIGVLTATMYDPPIPSLHLPPAFVRFAARPVGWTFTRHAGRRITLDRLSRAEQYWAAHAIGDALYWHRRDNAPQSADPLRLAITIFDEPEAGLHRSAEGYMSGALVEFARDPRRAVIAATHSPDLLDAPDAHLVEVKRNALLGGLSEVRELDVSHREALAGLGLNPSDLLRWPRVFLLVEGAHDEALLDELFSTRLRSARVQILPLRGATKLPATIDSRVLFEFTDAHIAALVDNQDVGQLAAAWEAALAARESGSIEAATSALADSLDGDTEELRFLREWLTAALRKGFESRVTPLSLSAGDVIEYVPVDAVVPSALDWKELRREHANARENGTGAPRDFKKWLTHAHGVVITPDLLREAISTSDTVPNELEQLMKTLEALSSEVGWRRVRS